jgi:hypothetical protein
MENPAIHFGLKIKKQLSVVAPTFAKMRIAVNNHSQLKINVL